MYIYFMLTNFCPARCSFCNACSSSKREKKLSPHDMLKVVDIGYKLGYKGIYFSGGEPITMLYDLIKVIKYAKNLGYPNIHIATNSFFGRTEKHAKKVIKLLEKSGLTHIYISFDYDHLKFIPYNNILNGIKAAINTKFRSLKIIVVDRKKTKKKNTEYLKKMAKDLGGKYYESFLSKFSFLLEKYSPEEKYNYIIIPGKRKIDVERQGLKYEGRGKKFKKEMKFKNIIDYLFRTCYTIPAIIIRWDGKILGCAYSEGFFNNNLVIGNIKDTNLKMIMGKPRELLFGEKFHPLLTPIKIYLAAKTLNIQKVKKIFISKYQNKCEFCMNLLNVVDIKKLRRPKDYEIFLFIIKNWHLFLKGLILDSIRNLMYLDLKYAFFKAKLFNLIKGRFF